MGQKINPVIFRQFVNRIEAASWISAKDKFFHLQDQDLEIRNFISGLLKSRGILLRSCKISRSAGKLQLYLDLYFSYILSKQSKFVWARSMFRTIKKKYDYLYKIRDIKDFIQEAELGEEEENELNSSLLIKPIKKKAYSQSTIKGKKYFLQKRKVNFIFRTKVISYKHRYLFFLLVKRKKNQPLVKKEDFSILSSFKNSFRPNIYRLKFAKLKSLFFVNKFRYSFQKFHLKSCLKAGASQKTDKASLLYLNKFLCKSLHNFTGLEHINLRVYSSQLSYLPVFKFYQRVLKSKLYLLQRNKDLKKYFFESLETLYFVLSTFGYGNAYLLSQLVVYMIENTRKHTLVTRFLKKSLEVFFAELPRRFFAVEGVRVLIKGRFNKRKRTKTIVVQKGEICLQTLKTTIDYHQTQAVTIYGSFGIKVWLAKKKKK